jgi:hypothetical protein
LYKTAQHATSSLQKRMSNNNLEESLETFPALLDNGIVKLVEVDLSGKRRNGDTSAFALEDIAEVFKVRVTTAHAAVAQLEGGDVCAETDLVGRVARRGSQAVGLRIAYLIDEWRTMSAIVAGVKTKRRRCLLPQSRESSLVGRRFPRSSVTWNLGWPALSSLSLTKDWAGIGSCWVCWSGSLLLMTCKSWFS